jgi:hypothetical protein
MTLTTMTARSGGAATRDRSVVVVLLLIRSRASPISDQARVTRGGTEAARSVDYCRWAWGIQGFRGGRGVAPGRACCTAIKTPASPLTSDGFARMWRWRRRGPSTTVAGHGGFRIPVMPRSAESSDPTRTSGREQRDRAGRPPVPGWAWRRARARLLHRDKNSRLPLDDSGDAAQRRVVGPHADQRHMRANPSDVKGEAGVLFSPGRGRIGLWQRNAARTKGSCGPSAGSGVGVAFAGHGGFRIPVMPRSAESSDPTRTSATCVRTHPTVERGEP